MDVCLARKEDYIRSCGYTIACIPQTGSWYALLPGETEFEDSMMGLEQNYLGLFASRNILVGEVYDEVFPRDPIYDAAEDFSLEDFWRLVAKAGVSDDELPQFLNREGFEGNTVLHCACRAGNVEVAVRLIELGASLQVRNYMGQAPLELDKAGVVRDWLASKNTEMEIGQAMGACGDDVDAPTPFRHRGLSL